MAGTRSDEQRVDDEEVRSNRILKEACSHSNWNSSWA
jgi:hypothetical protein